MDRAIRPSVRKPSAARPVLRSLSLILCMTVAGAPAWAQPSTEDVVVDVELVLAVDVSWSMDYEEQQIQREGYASAFRSEEVIEAVLYGGHGRIAVTYVEWAGLGSQDVVVGWTMIDSVEGAHAFARSLEEGMPRHFRRTSISAAIDFSVALFDDNGFQGVRRIIDISGDGPNNQGRPVTQARDDAVARGITINGLPLMTNPESRRSGYDIDRLDAYFTSCVIGGGSSFVIPVTRWEEFPVAIRRKLVLELASSDAPIEGADGFDLPVIRAQTTPQFSSDDCLVGEKIWQQRGTIWPVP
jgi:hypothetical protein